MESNPGAIRCESKAQDMSECLDDVVGVVSKISLRKFRHEDRRRKDRAKVAL